MAGAPLLERIRTAEVVVVGGMLRCLQGLTRSTSDSTLQPGKEVDKAHKRMKALYTENSLKIAERMKEDSND